MLISGAGISARGYLAVIWALPPAGMPPHLLEPWLASVSHLTVINVFSLKIFVCAAAHCHPSWFAPLTFLFD